MQKRRRWTAGDVVAEESQNIAEQRKPERDQGCTRSTGRLVMHGVSWSTHGRLTGQRTRTQVSPVVQKLPGIPCVLEPSLIPVDVADCSGVKKGAPVDRAIKQLCINTAQTASMRKLVLNK